MAKKETPAKRGKYDEKLKLKGPFEKLIKIIVKDADKKAKKS